ncbi:MAG: DUF2203 domain-containing protein [Acidobacteriota bacterium]
MKLIPHYSLAEANALLPLVRRVFEQVRPLHTSLQTLVSELTARGLGQVLERGAEPSDELVGVRNRAWALAGRIREHLLELEDLGIEVKAPDGLVDFRSRYRGRVVYLCWKWNEDEIGFFHELDTGFPGREPVEDPDEFVGDGRH